MTGRPYLPRLVAGFRVPRQQVAGASGGVGSYAVQLARALGAEVTGVCSTAQVDLVRSLGTAHVIGYTRDDFADGAHRYDLVIDIAGNPPCHGSGARSHPPGPPSSPAVRTAAT